MDGNMEPAYRIGLPITVIDDDEFGGLFLRGVAELWSGSDYPPEDEIQTALARSADALNGDPAKVLGIADIAMVGHELVIQSRNLKLPRLARTVLHFAGKDWKTQEVVTIFH